MDIFFPHTFRERDAFKESAVRCGFVELTAETTANVGILPSDERISTLLMAWKNIGNYLTKNPYNSDVGIAVSWVGRCTLNLWFGREWIACAIENKTDLIEQMMKVYPTAFITMHPYSWPYMFSIYRDPWMVEYLNLNFQRMSGPDLNPVLEPKDSEFIQQEGIPLLILRMVNMFDFRMVKLVKYMCLRLLLTWQDANSTASKTLRASPNADQYIDYARHIYLLAICESNGFKDLHYTLETIQRVVHCDLKAIWALELGAQAIAKGLQESNRSLNELLIAFLFKVPKLQFGNIFGAALTKYIHFVTEYQLRNINRLSSVKLPWPLQEVYSKVVEMFIAHRESSEELIKTTAKLSEQIFLGMHNLTASKCAYELIKQRHHAEWHTSKISLLLTIISEEINIIQDYKYNDVQSTDELIEKEKEVAIYYRDLAKLFHKSPYLEQEAWLTTFSLHPCREFMDAVMRCGGRNLRAIKKQAHKLNVIEIPEPKTKINEGDATNVLKEDDKEQNPQETINSNIYPTTVDPNILSTSTDILETSESVASNLSQDFSNAETKPKAKRQTRKKLDKNGPKKIEPKIKEKPKTKITPNISEENKYKEEKFVKRGRPVGSFSKDSKNRLRPTQLPKKLHGERQDLAEEIFAAAAGAAENIHSQTAETIKYPVFALMNSVTDTEELMKFTNYDEAFEQYTELNKILSRIKLNHTCYEDLLTLLIAPRYKRLTWAVSWKKLKKRCRVILTKDNKKREIVEQSMADANDRLTHLNIDYEKYKDKPQIDYGTIEGGYECYDTDSDDANLKNSEVDVKKTNERSTAKKRAQKLVGSLNEHKQIKGKPPNSSLGIKPYLKIENLDSSNTNLLNIIDSTHLSKPVYLNKPVYFVRNPLARPLNENTISLDTGPENQGSSRTSSGRTTAEEALTSDSFEEHHWHLTTTHTSPEITQNSQEQKIKIGESRPNNLICKKFLRTETTFNIPASIREQLEQPAMFFKSEQKNESNSLANDSKQKVSNTFQNKQTDISQPLHFSPTKVTNSLNHTATSNQIDSVSSVNTRFSPKLFEDMPEDLTIPKPLNNDLYETSTSLSNHPLSGLISDSLCKTISFEKMPPHVYESEEPPGSLTKTSSRKRKSKREEGSQDLKTQCLNDQLSSSQESIITQPTANLKSIRIFPHNKKSKAIRINPTAAVVFSSAAASYHRTPFLNVAQQEPNILHQLLSKEIKPFSGIDGLFHKSTEVDADVALKTEDERNILDKLDAQLGAIAVLDPINSTLEVQNSNIQNLLSATASTSNSKANITTNSTEEKIIEQIVSSSSVFCESDLKSSSVYKTDNCQVLENSLTSNALQNNLHALTESGKVDAISHSPRCDALVDDETRTFPTTSKNLDDTLKSEEFGQDDGQLAANNVMNSGSLMNVSKNIDVGSSEIEFEFKVPAAVAKPCFFMRSKQKKVSSYASDWVKNITFYERTAEVIVPVNMATKVPEMHDDKQNTKVKRRKEEERIKKKLCPNASKPLASSQSQSDDVLYNKHIVFNKKLLDPHLKTYKKTKASCKVTDRKKLKQTFSETNKIFSGNSEDSNVLNLTDKAQNPVLQHKEKDETSASDPCSSNVLSEHLTLDDLLAQPTTSHDRESSSPLSSTSQNTSHRPETILDSDIQQYKNSLVKGKKKRCRPSTKKFDRMFEWIEMVTTANREVGPKYVDTSDTLLNLFSAQLMNQAKSIHFNYEYLREKELLTDRVNDEGVNCEASILIASPGPSDDCVKLIKAFKKNAVFKGVDMSSNEVSFTSSLAKEILGTIIKVTLNDNNTHASCTGNHFDASDVLDDFIRSRRDAHSPTFYSPTLSVKHLKNGTLAESVECIDTSLEKLIPKPGRKRSSMVVHRSGKKRVRKHELEDNNTKEVESKNDSLYELNLLPRHDGISESLSESIVTDVLQPHHVQENTSDVCSVNVSENILIEIEELTKPALFPLEQPSIDQLPMQIINTSKYNEGQAFLTNENNILDIFITSKDPSKGILQTEKDIKNEFDSHELLNSISELNKQPTEYHSAEEKLMNDSDEPIKSDVKMLNIIGVTHDESLPIQQIQIKSSSAYHRKRRNTYNGTKSILKEDPLLNLKRKYSMEGPIKLSDELKSANEKFIKYSIGFDFTDEAKLQTENEMLNTTEINSSIKENQLLEETKEVKNVQIESLNTVFFSDKTNQLQLGELISMESDKLFGSEPLSTEEKNLLDKSSPEEINKIEKFEETEQPVVEDTDQFPMNLKYPLTNISNEEEKEQSIVKKRIVKPRISYAELDSDSDELPKSRVKIPSLKLNCPSIRPARRKLLNRSLKKKTVSSKSSSKRPTRINKIPTEMKNKTKRSKTNVSSSLNDSDDDKPLSSKINKPENDKVIRVSVPSFDDSDGIRSIIESDDDAPLKIIPKRLSSKKTKPPLLPPIKTKKNPIKPVRKKYRNTYSPKRPSLRIQNKYSRPRTTSLNYFALFLSDSDEDEPHKSKRRRRTPDRLWTRRAVKRKTPKESTKNKISNQRKLRCNRVAIKQRQCRKRLSKPKTPSVKMPVLTREDSDHAVEDNIYECAIMSTANDTDEDVCSNNRPKKRRQKVVKPMRIRCVSRRAIPTDVISESSSCSSVATIQTPCDFRSNCKTIASLPERGRLLRRKTLEKNLLMSKLLRESSSSSSPVMMNRKKRQFAVKSTSKPQFSKENDVYDKPNQNIRSAEPLTRMEREAIHNFNCVNFQIRLQRLTANEAVMCRKPHVRLDRNFVRNFFADKNLGYEEDLDAEERKDDNK